MKRSRCDEEVSEDTRAATHIGSSSSGVDAAVSSMIADVVAAARSPSTRCAADDDDDDLAAAVRCPVCRRHALQESADIIFCACGLRLDTSAEGGVSIAALQQRVDASLAMHTGSGCAHAPLLAVQSRFGLTMLQLSCARCNALQVVL